jgi:hypothetical protein
MSSEALEPTLIKKAPDGFDAQLTLLQRLTTEVDARAESLRCVQIPHHIGMAAAARALGADVPRALISQVQSDLSSGALAQTWEATLKRLSKDEGGQPTPEAALAAVAALLMDQAQRAGRYLAKRGDEWAADAYRLEGHATALDEEKKLFERAQEGIARSRAEGDRAAQRQEQRRAERERGEGPGQGGTNGNDA